MAMFIINAAYAVSVQFTATTEAIVSKAARLMQQLPCAAADCALHLYTQIGTDTLFDQELAEWVQNPHVQGQKNEAARRILEALHNNSATLDLDNLGLTALPPGLSQLRYMQELHINHNQLTTLKGLERCTQLITLLANNNQLDSLEGIENCSNLLMLCVGHNQLTHLHSLRGCTNLRVLHASYNQLEYVQYIVYLTKLISLSLTHNCLSSLPEMGHLSNLMCLFISHNPRLEDVPRGIDQLTDLTIFL
jgi:hypothetical protein